MRRQKQWYEDPEVDLAELRLVQVEEKAKKAAEPKHADSKENYRKAIDLFVGGTSIREIASQLGVRYGTAKRYIEIALDKQAEEDRDLRKRMVNLQLQRYNRILRHWVPIAEMAYDPAGNVAEVDLFDVALKAQDIVGKTLSEINKLLRLGVYADGEEGDAKHGPIQLNFNKVVVRMDGGKPVYMDVVDGEVVTDDDLPELEAGDDADTAD